MDIKHILQKLGFSKNESDVYLAAMELGVSSVQEISKKANIKRTTVYSVIDYLIEKGLVSKTSIKNKTCFLVEPPHKLMNLVSNVYEELRKQMPELEAIYNAKPRKPKIMFYEGKEAVQNVYDDTLREKPNEILEWNTNKYFERFPEQTYIKKRVELNIKARRMAEEGSVWHKKNKQRDKQELAETIILPKNKFNLDIEVNIYNDKVAFLNYAENISVIIESKPIANAMKQVYELSWVGGKANEIK